MSLKTKGRCGKLGAKQECHRKQRWLYVESWNLVEKKEGR
jgi:hypothetical protein